jgi:hypothetical protein
MGAMDSKLFAREDSLLFGGWQRLGFGIATLRSFLAFVTFRPLRKESLTRRWIFRAVEIRSVFGSTRLTAKEERH